MQEIRGYIVKNIVQNGNETFENISIVVPLNNDLNSMDWQFILKNEVLDVFRKKDDMEMVDFKIAVETAAEALRTACIARHTLKKVADSL
jgi:hypothetical protein